MEQLVDWKKDLNSYIAAGAALPSDEDRRHSLLKMLPGNLSMEMKGKAFANQTFADLEAWIIAQKEFAEDYGGGSGNARVMQEISAQQSPQCMIMPMSADHPHPMDAAVPTEAPLGDGAGFTEADIPAYVLHGMDERAREGLILAVRSAQQRGQQPRRWGAQAQRPRVPAPPRDVRDAKCANCGATGHTAQACKKAKVPLEDRR